MAVLKRFNKRHSLTKHAAGIKSAARTRQSKPGEHTLQEILSQPRVWTETETQLREAHLLEKLYDLFSPRSPWLFVGCGSSYYLSRLIAALWTKHFYIPATGVPASELLFAPEGTLRRLGAEQVVLMSRSGETTEVLRAAELLQKHPTVQTLAVTCNPQSPLETLCTRSFKLTWADEKSTVMTRSFTAILLAFQRLGLQFVGDNQFSGALDQLPQRGQQCLAANAKKIQEFTARKKFADYVFLGHGAHYWLPHEPRRQGPAIRRGRGPTPDGRKMLAGAGALGTTAPRRPKRRGAWAHRRARPARAPACVEPSPLRI